MSCREHYVSAHGHAVVLTPDIPGLCLQFSGAPGSDGWGLLRRRVALRAEGAHPIWVRGACEAFDELRSSSLGRIIQAPKSLPMRILKNLGLQHW